MRRFLAILAFSLAAGTVDALPKFTIDEPFNLATNQVSCGTTATLVVAARPGRKSLMILNEGATEVRLGASGVTTGAGLLLYGQKGAGVVIDGGAAVYCVVASGTQTISSMEAY